MVNDDFPLDDLPLPKVGKSRQRTATERLNEQVPAPPPPPNVVRRTEPVKDPTPADPTPPANEPIASDLDRKKRAAPPKRPERQAAPTQAPTSSGDCAASIPESLITLMDKDTRSRSNLLRAAFSQNAPSVVEANPPEPAPLIEGMEPTRRRASNPDDPFADVLFRLRPNERELLDEWVSKTTLTRSAFVTELLKLELN